MTDGSWPVRTSTATSPKASCRGDLPEGIHGPAGPLRAAGLDVRPDA